MSWQRRLAELAIAGGLTAACASSAASSFDDSGQPNVPPCNANPDPCCDDPDGGQCAEEQECAAHPDATCCAKWSYGAVAACTSLAAGDDAETADAGGDAGSDGAQGD